MIACKFCIMEKGLQGGKGLFETQEELDDHIEGFHHMPIIKEGETKEQLIKRFIKKYPEAKTCPKCIAANAPWTKGG